MNQIRIPIIAGLVAGTALILVFFVFFFLGQRHIEPSNFGRIPQVSEVTIPVNASMNTTARSGFDPNPITVMIGINNTVRWENHDNVAAWIAADNESDPDFYNATKDFVYILPNKTFDYTFTKVGEFGYHGKPWQRASVIVLPFSSSQSATQ